jgi:peroxiredoxin Q/BCP
MTQVSLGQAVPDFEAASTGEKSVRLSELKGKNVVIYFYPKDSTPGCTTEGQNFRDNIDFFNEHDTVIFGVSKDSLRSHENFKTKQCFPFDLLSDPEEALCKHFDVIKLKKMYGKEYMGIERSTFLIDKEGTLVHEWRKVKVKGHVDEVINAIKEL